MSEQTDSIELAKLRKEIWAKAVDTQMHFNEMSGKSRQLGLSFVVAALGVAVVLLSRDADTVSLVFEIAERKVNVHAAGVIVLVAAAGLFAVKSLDLGVYHQMLRGAVAFGEELEKASVRDSIMQTSLGMTELISMYSRNNVVKKTVGPDGKTLFTTVGPTTAKTKIERFYRWGIVSLLLIAAALIYVFGDVERLKEGDAIHTSHTIMQDKVERSVTSSVEKTRGVDSGKSAVTGAGRYADAA